MIKKFIMITILATFLLSNQNDTMKINQLIHEIQNSKQEDRYKKMNEFKVLLRKMNSDARVKAISNLQKKVVSKKIPHNLKKPMAPKLKPKNIKTNKKPSPLTPPPKGKKPPLKHPPKSDNRK